MICPRCSILNDICHDAAPNRHSTQSLQLLPIALLHAGGHLAAVLSMSAGAVSFTHIIKASEPVASTAIGPFFGVEMQVRVRATHSTQRAQSSMVLYR